MGSSMPIPFLILMTLVGLFYVVFAFVEPPNMIRGLFRVPAIFVFLPDRWVVPAGRLVVGVLILVGMAVLSIRVGFG